MAKSDINNAIIRFLSESDGFVSAEAIADKIGVSKKTVYRHITELNSAADKPYIVTEPGKGIHLVALPESPAAVSGSVRDVVGPLERRNHVMMQLLFSAPKRLTIDELFKDEYVSEATIDSDLNAIRTTVKAWQLKLERHDNRVQIIGEELDIREAINHLLQHDLDMTLLKPSKDLNAYDYQFIQQQIAIIEDVTNGKLNYPYNVNIFSHLYILLKRARENSKVADISTTQLRDDSDKLKENIHLYRLAGIVIGNISRYLSKPLPDSEVVYLFQYLSSSRLGNGRQQERLVKYPQLVTDVTAFFAENMASLLNTPFDEHVIVEDLSRHIAPMLNRLENGISVSNGLLSEIKEEYPVIYSSSHAVAEEASNQFNLPTISDNEVGFITIYFAKYLEQHQHQLRTIIVCASGIGTSELLRVKVGKTFSNLQVVGTEAGASKDLPTKVAGKADFIISTIDLSQFALNIPVINVTALLNAIDKERIKHEIAKLSAL